MNCDASVPERPGDGLQNRTSGFNSRHSLQLALGNYRFERFGAPAMARVS